MDRERRLQLHARALAGASTRVAPPPVPSHGSTALRGVVGAQGEGAGARGSKRKRGGGKGAGESAAAQTAAAAGLQGPNGRPRPGQHEAAAEQNGAKKSDLPRQRGAEAPQDGTSAVHRSSVKRKKLARAGLEGHGARDGARQGRTGTAGTELSGADGAGGKQKRSRARARGAAAAARAGARERAAEAEDAALQRKRAALGADMRGSTLVEEGRGSAWARKGKGSVDPLGSGRTAQKARGGLLEKMKARLHGGRFRMLNEALYTQRGEEALGMFSHEPAAFQQYHEGYREQVARWPQNPLDSIISWLKTEDPKGSLTVADFGCGEARLAASVEQEVHSFDLVACNERVTACNIASTPLEDCSVHVAVFCLSLMGTDYPDFLREAHRVLKPGGWLLMAEVKSRFEADEEGAFNALKVCMAKLGFRLVENDERNKMFVLCKFQKMATPVRKWDLSEWPALKPCMYKRR